MSKDEAEMNLDAVNGGDTLLTVHRIASGLFRSGTFDKATMYAAFFAVFMVNVIVVIYIVYVVKDPSNFSNKKAQDIKKE